MWAEELRRADERTLKFKSDLIDAERRRGDMEQRLKDLERALASRDMEI